MAIMEISVEVPKKLKIELLYHMAIPLLGMYTKDCMFYHRATHISIYIATVNILRRKYNLEVYYQIDNEDKVHIPSGILFICKKSKL